MKVLLLCTSADGGGAAHATRALQQALNDAGLEARLLTLFPYRGEPSPHIDSLFSSPWTQGIGNIYKAYERLDIIRHNRYRLDALWRFSSAPIDPQTLKHPWIDWADVIHLHWINHGLLSIHSIKQLTQGKKPIVWTLHDLWAVTGGCHLPFLFHKTGITLCPEYTNACRACPLLKGYPQAKAYSQHIYRQKQAFQQANITYIAVSAREATILKQSPLTEDSKLRYKVIPPPILNLEADSTEVQLPLPQWYNPQVDYLLLVAARIDDPVKGISLLEDMCRELAMLKSKALNKSERDIELILVGDLQDHNLIHRLPIATHALGRKNGAELLQLYRLASICLSTSIFETFGLTLAESLSQGTPVIAFRSYGPEDIIQQGINGYLVDDYQPNSMAQYILTLLDDIRQGRVSPEVCRSSIAQLSQAHIAQKHIELYRSLI